MLNSLFPRRTGWGAPIASWDYSTNVAQVDFTNLGVYGELLIQGYGLQHNDAGNQGLTMLWSTDNGSNFASSGYQNYGGSASGSVLLNNSAANTAILGFVVSIIDWNSAARYSMLSGNVFKTGTATDAHPVMGRRTTLEAHNALRILPGASSIVAGAIRIWGRR